MSQRRLTNLFLVGYLALQLALPLRGLLFDKLETRGDFSWNMYSQLYECRSGYRKIDSRGRSRPVNVDALFSRHVRVPSLHHRDRLFEFHAYLCDETLRWERSSQIRGLAMCSLNGGEEVDLIDRRVDLCTDSARGVLAR